MRGRVRVEAPSTSSSRQHKCGEHRGKALSRVSADRTLRGCPSYISIRAHARWSLRLHWPLQTGTYRAMGMQTQYNKRNESTYRAISQLVIAWCRIRLIGGRTTAIK